MALFPQSELTEFAGNGAIALPGETAGVMPGLEWSLLHLLRNFRPADMGIAGLNEKIQLTLPMPDWAKYVFLLRGSTASIDAGSGASIVIHTVPTDERARLLFARYNRASGDNLVATMPITFPTDYFEGAAELLLIELSANAVNLHWPDLPAEQAITYQVPAPMDLLPGTDIILKPASQGVAATIYDFTLLIERTKLVPAMAP